ncbi:MAG TPA: hypothetical protein VE907_04385 [Gammaproteobacteria bacterium]|nr:hypothetical protein [Gammaproteobacteria bacterium]
MSGFFITEKETEALLERETRAVKLPDGTSRQITDFKVMWENFDFLTKTTGFSEARLVELAFMSIKESGRSFEESFPNIVAYTAQCAKECLSRDKPD